MKDVERAPKMFPIIVTVPRPMGFILVGSPEVTEAYIIGENEYSVSPRAMKLKDKGSSPTILVKVKINSALINVAMLIAFFLPRLSARKPLDTLAKNPAAGIKVATNPAAIRLIPLDSTRNEGAKVNKVLRQRLYIE